MPDTPAGHAACLPGHPSAHTSTRPWCPGPAALFSGVVTCLAGDTACMHTLLQGAMGPQGAAVYPVLTTECTLDFPVGRAGGHPWALTLSDAQASSSDL